MAPILTLEQAKALGILAGSSCAFGVFDGVHRGHRWLLSQAAATAGDGSSIALTFDIDPDELFCPDGLVKLMTNRARHEALARSGVDAVVLLPFTREFAALSPEEFLEEVFGGAVPAHVHVGYDLRFGSKASGDVAAMASWGEPHGMAVHSHDLLYSSGAPVTATRIRRLIRDGCFPEAASLLGPESADVVLVVAESAA